MAFQLKVNGGTHSVDVIRHAAAVGTARHLGLTGTKFGCGMAQCGACTVHLDGKPLRSCSLPVSAVGTKGSRPSKGLRTRSESCAERVGRSAMFRSVAIASPDR